MNLFVTDQNPVTSARNLDDKRLIKMCLETTQLLCSAINFYDGNTPYKTTHLNHPVTVWVRTNRANWSWAFMHGLALCQEYTARYGKIHKCESILRSIEHLFTIIPDGTRTQFVNCAANNSLGIDFKHIADPIEAYRKYLTNRWNNDKQSPSWGRFQAIMMSFKQITPMEWLGVDNSGKFFYKGETYEVLFGGPNEKQNKPIGIVGDYKSAIP